MSEFLPQQLCRPFKAVLFDLDGTLFDSEEVHYSAFRQALKEVGYDFDALSADIPYQGNFRKLYQGVAKKLQFDEAEFAVIYNRKLEITLEYPPHEIEFVDGTLSFLELLQDHGVPMAVVTNSDRAYADNLLQTHELMPFFDHVLTATELVDEAKPHPGGYMKAASLLMIDPVDILVFENTDAGITAGKAAGMSVIAIRTTDVGGFSTYEAADYSIDSFADVTLNELQFIRSHD